MKKIFAMLMLAVMLFSLCACGGNGDVTTAPQNEDPTDPVTTAPQPTDPTEPESTGTDYTIKVVDEGGNPVAGVKVQMCDASNLCKAPKTTDENGIAVYEDQEDGQYKAQLTKLPEGYEAEDMEAYYPFGSNTEVTITIKAVS